MQRIKSTADAKNPGSPGFLLCVDWPYITEVLGVKGAMFHLRHWNASVSHARFRQVFRTLFHLVESGQPVVPRARHTYPLVQVRQALQDYESGRFGGGEKIMLGKP
ncbi:hypothetical protein [Marinococcus luteus]|uniref:hypothetical protein n=1 Tax=Marinococcus luteus TaxID=1122204 RepID=UPI002ACC81F4|nr:hypothetical protein [Marinococcus luteus]MDZ5784377.1 hypothetical protein [Marinococcus luteus]